MRRDLHALEQFCYLGMQEQGRAQAPQLEAVSRPLSGAMGSTCFRAVAFISLLPSSFTVIRPRSGWGRVGLFVPKLFSGSNVVVSGICGSLGGGICRLGKGLVLSARWGDGLQHATLGHNDLWGLHVRHRYDGSDQLSASGLEPGDHRRGLYGSQLYALRRALVCDPGMTISEPHPGYEYRRKRGAWNGVLYENRCRCARSHNVGV